MPRVAVQDSERMNLRVKSEQKARLLRAASLRNTDLTDFVLRLALREADAVIEEAERVDLSSRDFSRVMDLLENPPTPNDKLRAAVAGEGADRPRMCRISWRREISRQGPRRSSPFRRYPQARVH